MLWAGEADFLDCLGSEWGERTQEKYVRVAGDTADIETGQLMIQKRCLCPTVLCNYKCLNIGIFSISVVWFLLFCHEEESIPAC